MKILIFLLVLLTVFLVGCDSEPSILVLNTGSSGGVQGSNLSSLGTAGYLALFQNSTTINNSIIQEQDGKIMINGNGEVTNDFIVDTNTIFVNASSNRVGINTVTPDEALTIQCASGLCLHVRSTSGALIKIDRATISNTGSVQFQTAGVGKVTFGLDNDNTNDFHIGDTSSFSTTWLFINVTNGYTGIGLLRPATMLDIDGVGANLQPQLRLRSLEGNSIASAEFLGGFDVYSQDPDGGGQSGSIRFNSPTGQAHTALQTPADLTFWTTGLSELTSTERMRITKEGYVGIGNTTPPYPLTIGTNVSGVSLWVQANISAAGYITRTDVYDATKTSKTASESIKNSTAYIKPSGEINHAAFEYSYMNYTIPITKAVCHKEETCKLTCNPENNTECNNICEQEDICTTSTTQELEEGIDLVKEIALLKQALYEQITLNKAQEEKIKAIEAKLPK